MVDNSTSTIRPLSHSCPQYAGLMSHLGPGQARAMFIVLFIFVMFLLSVGFWLHEYRAQKITKLEAKIPKYGPQREDFRNEYKPQRKRLCWEALGLFLVAVGCTITQVFTLFAIQHCHKEELITLFWAVWTTFQFGMCLALLGVIIQIVLEIAEISKPSTPVAMGTPILVWGAIQYLLFNSPEIYRRLWKGKWPEPDVEEGQVPEKEEEEIVQFSRATTLARSVGP